MRLVSRTLNRVQTMKLPICFASNGQQCERAISLVHCCSLLSADHWHDMYADRVMELVAVQAGQQLLNLLTNIGFSSAVSDCSNDVGQKMISSIEGVVRLCKYSALFQWHTEQF